MQFLLLASHVEGRQRRRRANKLFLLYFAMQCHLLFCLRKNYLLFPNPQPIAKPSPAVGPKLNKSVVWKRKLLGWRRAQHRAERPHSSQLKPVCSCLVRLLLSPQAPSLIPKEKGYVGQTSCIPGPAVIFYFCYSPFYDLRSRVPESFWTECSCLVRELHPPQGWLQLRSLLCLRPAASAAQTQSHSVAHENLNGEFVGAMGEKREMTKDKWKSRRHDSLIWRRNLLALS